MMSDGIKNKEREHDVKVYDLAEMLLESMWFYNLEILARSE
jgi:hypothetical protein